MFSIRRFKAVAKKEFLEMKRNKLFFLMTVLAPLILYFLFAYGFPLDVKNIPMGVIDFDKTKLSRELLDTFESGRVFKIKVMADNYDTIEKYLSLSVIRAAVVIPHEFSRNLSKGMPTKIQILVDGTYPNHANIVSGYLEATIFAFRISMLENFFTKVLGSGGTTPLPIDLNVSVWYNPSFRSEDFIIPGVIAIIMMFFPPLIGAISLAKEKETGSILNMYCSSVTKGEYILGKMLPYVIISYINFILFLLCTVFVFDVPLRGSLLFLLIISFFYVTTAIAIGFMEAIFVNTQIAAIIMTAVTTLTPSFLYSGFMVPVSNLGKDSAYIAHILPATYYIDLMRKVMIKGASPLQVGSSAIAIIVFCFGICAITIFLFKKRLE